MSRKFDRRRQINRNVREVVSDPRFVAQLFKPKPKWMPKFVWGILIKLLMR